MTVLVGLSGSVPLFTSEGHVMRGGWLSRMMQIQTSYKHLQSWNIPGAPNEKILAKYLKQRFVLS